MNYTIAWGKNHKAKYNNAMNIATDSLMFICDVNVSLSSSSS